MFGQAPHRRVALIQLAAFALLVGQLWSSVHEISLASHDDHAVCEVCVVKQNSGDALAVSDGATTFDFPGDTKPLFVRTSAPVSLQATSKRSRAPPA